MHFGFGDSRGRAAAARGVSRMTDQLNLYQPLALFVPNSAGDSAALLDLTLQAVHQTFPFLNHLLQVLGKEPPLVVGIDQFPTDDAGRGTARRLASAFDRFGSDKSSGRDYHLLYGEILKNPEAVSCVLEIGLGTNHLDVVSNMGAQGRPGASLRAFRECLPNAVILGADVDTRVLFEEERIRTHHVDQTDLASFESLGRHVPDAVDLIIDDGLHSPNANLAVLAFAVGRLKVGGWLVVEDIPERAIPFWNVVAALLPDTFAGNLVRAKGALAFALRKNL